MFQSRFRYAPVAPEETSFLYFFWTPVTGLSTGLKSLRRAAISSSESLTFSDLAGMSMSMMSPSLMAAMGPPA